MESPAAGRALLLTIPLASIRKHKAQEAANKSNEAGMLKGLKQKVSLSGFVFSAAELSVDNFIITSCVTLISRCSYIAENLVSLIHLPSSSLKRLVFALWDQSTSSPS